MSLYVKTDFDPQGKFSIGKVYKVEKEAGSNWLLVMDSLKHLIVSPDAPFPCAHLNDHYWLWATEEEYLKQEEALEQVREMYPLPNEKVSDEVGARKFKLWDKVEYEVESVEYEGVVVGYDHDCYVVKTQYEDMISDYYEQFSEESLTLVTNPLDMITQILYNTQGIENQTQEILNYMEENK